MTRPESIETHGRIFGNGIRQASNPVGGVDEENWKFNPETQNYDYIGEPDEIAIPPVLPKLTIDQKTPIIREVAPVR